MNRFHVRVFSALLALTALAAALVPARAQEAPPSFWFAGTRLIFARAVPLDGDVAVSVRDPGLQRFLARLGATLSFAPEERYIVITAADRRTITFALGSPLYTAGGVTARAAFPPYLDGNQAILPLYSLAHALYVEPVPGAGETILQPQIGALDIHADGKRTVVVIRGATQLAYVKRVETPEHLELAFSGVASTLAAERKVGGATISVVSGGSPKNPSTVITFDAPRGAEHEFTVPASPFEVGLAFTGLGSAPVAALPAPAATPFVAPLPVATASATAPPAASIAPPPPPPLLGASPSPAAVAFASPVPSDAALAASPPPGEPATVTGVVLTPAADGLEIRVTVQGGATYDWHRLADLRWYVDIHGATLTDAGRDERPTIPAVDSVRIRQISTPLGPAVRIALTMRGEKHIDVVPAPDGFTIDATNVDEVAAARTGSGRIGSPAVDPSLAVAPLPTPSADPSDLTAPPGWKFGPTGNGARIIVLDPGHGGADMGTAHNGLVEKSITIDIARRLRTLLVAQGWSVRMTRDSDIDPVSQANLTAMAADGKPNASDRAYLQTRCDVANNVNARLFISIHVNYSDSPSVNGTTFYWYKPQDQQLATTLEKAVIPVAGTSDLGPVRDNFYVIHHTTMPAVLIETAFISNPHDAALLASPAFLQNMAAGIASGVKAYAGTPPPVQASQADQ
jgi:N-acetylmuramoyl-L-alanine amidase